MQDDIRQPGIGTRPTEKRDAPRCRLFIISVVVIQRIEIAQTTDVSYAHACFYEYGSEGATEQSMRNRVFENWRQNQPGDGVYDIIVKELFLHEIRKECPQCF
jgi:hypothetical protein